MIPPKLVFSTLHFCLSLQKQNFRRYPFIVVTKFIKLSQNMKMPVIYTATAAVVKVPIIARSTGVGRSQVTLESHFIGDLRWRFFKFMSYPVYFLHISVFVNTLQLYLSLVLPDYHRQITSKTLHAMLIQYKIINF